MYGSGVNLHYPLDELVAQAGRWVAAGFDAVKVKVGSPDLADDVRRIGAVREVIGPDRRLMIDANQRWTLDQAERAVGELAAFDLAWIEEPLRADDLAGARGAPRAHRRADRARREPAHPLPLRRVHRRGRRSTSCSRTSCASAASRRSSRSPGWPPSAASSSHPHLLLELSAQVALAMPGEHLVEAVEDASFESLGALAAPSPVVVDGNRVRTTGQTGLGLRFAPPRADAAASADRTEEP